MVPSDDENGVGEEDMVKLTELNEHTILKNLKLRYQNELIYTYTGSILVAVNPYRMSSIYGLDTVKKYEGQLIGDLPPHLFAISSASYSKMMKATENQVLVISGESGAGKTESTKLIMQYLAAVNKSGNNLITEQILEANPLLESFGNAKTIRNDNSSRFGKYIEVYFKSGSIVGAKTSEYLLEKSRIVTQAPEERNYHVFYEMLEALTDDEKAKYGLQTAPKYFYLNQGGSSLIPGRDDAANYQKLVAAMEILNFEKQEQETILKILASVLHTGNIYFKSVIVDNHDSVELGSEAEIKWISHLLDLSVDWLKQALVSKITEAREERMVSPYNLDQALDARDAMAKALYGRLFTWLVERVNLIICRAERDKTTSLAVLDIFGFEDFQLNSFEQLCINYANETLQYFFNQHIFRIEQKEYSKEKIRWEHIEFKDNQPTIDLITTKPAGILLILDDESNFPQATDQSFLEKCHFHHSGNELYDKPRMSDPEFFITHYAGKIKYNVQHFLEKNKDTLRSDVIELMCESKNKIISQMFNDLRNRLITKTLSKTTGRFITLKPRTTTVAASFNESLLSLIDTMSRCNPFFVRCIKPNASKSPMIFEDIVVMDQLRYTGMLETIRIRKMGYPVRVKFPQFIERYQCLLKGQPIKPETIPWDICKLIVQTQGREYKNEYQIGASKVFMKEIFEQRLDTEARRVQLGAAIKLQTYIRMFITQKRHQNLCRSTQKIQRMLRMLKARRNFLKVRRGIILAQSKFRMHRQRLSYLKTQEEIHRQLQMKNLAVQKHKAQEKMEREHKEKQARMMASIANLDIPGELAYVYSRTDDWEPYHQGQHIITALGDVVPMDMAYKLPVDINAHVFSKYASVYFKNPDWGVQLEPIITSLTPVQGYDNLTNAVNIFKLILRFMFDLHMNEKKDKILCDFIVQMGLKNESLRDEIFCQLVNQAWKNQHLDRAKRVWQLLANCLCCFNPSPTLFKYLLKYVSDVGFEDYKVMCQHKILQSAFMDPQLSRRYPPTYLEWKALSRTANMAIEATFPDDMKMIGHVESWTSGELFTSHLLKLRGMHDNSQGWTLMLQEDTDFYELMGYDFVLDLISEIEIVPGFPAGTAYFLVSVDKSRERAHQKQYHSDGPHNPEKERKLILTSPIPEMIKRDVPITTTKNRQFATIPEEDFGFSTTSKLNQRPTEIIPSGLSEESNMNARYTKRSRAPAPPISKQNSVNGSDTVQLSINVENQEENRLSNLSRNKLNGRYLQNGDARTSDVGDLSYSKLNNRYSRKNHQNRGKGVSDQIRRKNLSSHDGSVISDHTDWSHLVEDIFSNALNDHDEPSAQQLSGRIKGGGKGVPGVQQAPAPLTQPLNLNLNLTNPAVSPPPVFNPLHLPGQSTVPPYTEPLQQIAQQQAVLQAYFNQQRQQQEQALLQMTLQQQQQQQQSSLQASQQQTTALKTALQQQELQNKLLKQSIEQEVLKQQLHQIQLQQQLSPGSSFNISFDQSANLSSSNMFPVVPSVAHPAVPPASIPNGHFLQTQRSENVDLASPRTFNHIKTSFESQETKSPPPAPAPKVYFNQNRHDQFRSTVAASDSINITSSPKESQQPHVSFSEAPSMHTQPSVPPAPPPPPPIPTNIDVNNGAFTLRDRSGRARSVRVGKVVWPPPMEREEKDYSIKVGKLHIDDHTEVVEHIERSVSSRKQKKSEPPNKDVSPPKSILKKDDEQEPKFKRTKSLVETQHLHTIKLLEEKLGGVTSNTENETKPKESKQNVSPSQTEQLLPVTPSPPPKEITKVKKPLEVYNSDPEPAAFLSLPEPEQSAKIDYSAFEKVATELFPQNKRFFLMYNKVPWILHIRKEVFWPSEKLENPTALHLIYCQIVGDVYNNGCIRITKDQRIKMRSMLDSYGVSHNNYLSWELKPYVKKVIVDTAREWATYFCRLFPVAASGQQSVVSYLGVSHTGLRLVTRERGLVDDCLSVLEDIKLEDVIDVVLPTGSTVQLNLRTKSLIFLTTRARQLKDMVDRFCQESDKGNKYIVAIKDYITRESTLLSFNKGDIIKLMDPEMNLESGWLYGSLNGFVGMFPAEYAKHLKRHEVDVSAAKPVLYRPKSQPPLSPRDRQSQDDRSETSQGTVVADGKFSMMEYAMLHFRESIEKYEMLRSEDGSIRGTVKRLENVKLQNMKNKENSNRVGSADWSWKEQADLIKWTRSPIQASLLKLKGLEHNKFALECFIAIMQFMGDYPMGSNMTLFDCAKKILKNCHKYYELRDEVFCQLCKQTTNNRSMFHKSKIRGWRLFALVAAYFDCSDLLRPYLLKYLEMTASDSTRTYNSAAALCLNNLRKTFKYGGRKDVPLREEVTALADGRNCKRFPFFYSGADIQGGMLQVKSCTVVQDAIEEVCLGVGITDPVEMDEYTFFVRTGDGAFSKLSKDEYILDETAYYVRRQIPYDLIFQRTVWYFPLKHLNNNIYVDMMFHQCILDYIEGFLVMRPGGKLSRETADDIASLGAILHKANNMFGTPTLKDLDVLIPRTVRLAQDCRPQHWLNTIHEKLATVAWMSQIQAKRQFVEILKQWRLFGSTFFVINSIPNIGGRSVLAVNSEGISFLRQDTHEVIMQHSFGEVLSTRRYRSDSNINYLDMKLGNLMVQQILRIETDQGSDISDLIGQYLQVINRNNKRTDHSNQNGYIS